MSQVQKQRISALMAHSLLSPTGCVKAWAQSISVSRVWVSKALLGVNINIRYWALDEGEYR
jgi:hypothetical protein